MGRNAGQGNLGYLKNRYQAAEKLSRDGNQDDYEPGSKIPLRPFARSLGTRVGSSFLGGVVERYRPSVQTQKLAPLSDITGTDCKTVETAMTKCSTWLPGHDKAPPCWRHLCQGLPNSRKILRRSKLGSRVSASVEHSVRKR